MNQMVKAMFRDEAYSTDRLGQEEDVRMQVMPAFLSTLSGHVSQVENAMQ